MFKKEARREVAFLFSDSLDNLVPRVSLLDTLGTRLSSQTVHFLTDPNGQKGVNTGIATTQSLTHTHTHTPKKKKKLPT